MGNVTLLVPPLSALEGGRSVDERGTAPAKAEPLSTAAEERLDEPPGKRALGTILNASQIRVTNCNDEVALARLDGG